MPRLAKLESGNPELRILFSVDHRQIDLEDEGIDLALRCGRGEVPGRVSLQLFDEWCFLEQLVANRKPKTIVVCHAQAVSLSRLVWRPVRAARFASVWAAAKQSRAREQAVAWAAPCAWIESRHATAC